MDEINEECLESILNCHGVELYSVLRENAVFENDEILLNRLCKFQTNRLSLSRQSCSNKKDDFDGLDRKVRKFVLQNWKKLFVNSQPPKPKWSDGFVEKGLFSKFQAVGETPAFENFLSISTKEAEDRFFNDVRIGDIVYTEVRSIENFSAIVRLLCIEGHMLQRHLSDLHIETYIGRDEFTKQSISWNDLSKHTLIRAVVLFVDISKRLISLSLAYPSTQEQITNALCLGIVNETELPSYFRIGESRDRETYNDCLGKSVGFRNPNAMELLCEHLNLPTYRLFTFLDTLNNVAKGVEKLRQNEATVAMQHFNKALDVEPDNAEAFVGRGALYANKNSFMLAIKDFEDALRIDENHVNATKYLLETLLAQCKVQSSNDSTKGNATVSKRRESLNSDNKSANSDDDIRRQLQDLYKKYGVNETTLVEDQNLMEKLKRYKEKYDKTMKLNSKNVISASKRNHEERESLSSYSENDSSSSDASPSTSDSSMSRKRRRSRSRSSSSRKRSSWQRRRISEETKSRHEFGRKRRDFRDEEKQRSKIPDSNTTKFSYSERSTSKPLPVATTVRSSREKKTSDLESSRKNGDKIEMTSSSSKLVSRVVARNPPPSGPVGEKLKTDLKNMEDFINSLKTKQK